MATPVSPRITSFLIKLASRCNLDCDYCYVYHHADQSWRGMPKLLSVGDRTDFARRLATYAKEADLKRAVVLLHGGEPLLAGADEIVAFAAQLRAAVAPDTALDVGIQTNGLLLTDRALAAFEAAQIGVSLSLDGPKAANDLHRTSRRGRTSFDRVFAALGRLKRHRKAFAGVIAVIDPRVRPAELFEFFDQHELPRLDFLLPDSHHLRPPPGRDVDPQIYRDWLIEAFDLWFDRYSHLPVRTFEALLDAATGLPSSTDAFGLGDVSLITIETDGTYHDLDVLKVVGDGATRLSGSVRDTEISVIANSPALARHRAMLTKGGLNATCQACSIVEICGGGSLPHRFGPNGFDHPTVYCGEMLALVGHVKSRLATALAEAKSAAPAARIPVDFSEFERAESARHTVEALWRDSCAAQMDGVAQALSHLERTDPDLGAFIQHARSLDEGDRRELASRPGVVAWHRTVHAQASGRALHTVDGAILKADGNHLQHMLEARRTPGETLAVGRFDPWLQAPFGTAIVFEPEEVAAKARPLAKSALEIIRNWRPALAVEMETICRDIQFIRDPTAHPEKIVSFSDNSVPGALFVSVVQGERLIDEYDLADSLIHEHRHQKLYLLERQYPMVEATGELVVSPWREDLRPPSGLLHAIFVFVELRRFWMFVRDRGPARLATRAINQLADTNAHLDEGFRTLAACPLTEAGKQLAAVLDRVRSEQLAEA